MAAAGCRCGCSDHRNRRPIADGQAAGFNVGYGASISDRPVSVASLFLPSARLKASEGKFQVKTGCSQIDTCAISYQFNSNRCCRKRGAKRFKPLIAPRHPLYFIANSSAHLVGSLAVPRYSCAPPRRAAPPLSRQRQFSSSTFPRRMRVGPRSAPVTALVRARGVICRERWRLCSSICEALG